MGPLSIITGPPGGASSGCHTQVPPSGPAGSEEAALPAPGSVALDRAALVALYEVTDGPNWFNSANWLTSSPIGEWHGVTTDRDGRVVGLDLLRNRLTGSIPEELASLARLESLNLGGNDLSGPFPVWLGNLTRLEALTLDSNLLTGPIPADLGRLTNPGNAESPEQSADRADSVRAKPPHEAARARPWAQPPEPADSRLGRAPDQPGDAGTLEQPSDRAAPGGAGQSHQAASPAPLR